MMRRGRHQRRKKQGSARILVGIIAGLLLGTGVIRLCDEAIRPNIIAAATDQLANQIEDEVGGVVESLLADGEMKYSDICTVFWDENGQMRGLQTDLTQLNQLKTEIATHVAEQFDNTIVNHKIQIPLGSVIPLLPLQGQGPSITVVVLSAGNVSAEFDNEFVSTGINQTLHRVALRVETKLHLLLPGGVYEYTEETRLVLAETVLMGEVPDSYSYFEQVDDAAEAYRTGRYRSDQKN